MRKAARAIIIKDDKLLLMYRNKFGLEYYSLIGGEVEVNETPEETLLREMSEEASILVENPRLVIVEDAGKIYGTQYIYLVDYVSGEPTLDVNSTEYLINLDGKNLYKPLWVEITQLPALNLLPIELKDTLLHFLSQGFPDQPINVKIN